MLRLYVSLILLGLSGTSAFATVISTTVDGKAMPWITNAGLNSAFGYGIGDGLAPVIVDASSGLSFAAGVNLVITRTGGFTTANDPAAPLVDGLGYTSLGPANNNTGSTGEVFPSFHTSADWNTSLMALMGTFADAAGSIVGTPFEIGNGRSIIIPVGATRLQLGLNDDLFADNGGALNLTISDGITGGGGNVPVPGTLALLAPMLLMLRNKRRLS